MKLIRIIKDKAERILLLILLGVLILYIAKEVYIDQIQLRLLQLKYQLSLSGKDRKKNSWVKLIIKRVIILSIITRNEL